MIALLIHGMPPAIPLIEIAHHTHSAGIGGPDNEVDACDAVNPAHVRPGVS